MRLEEPFTMLSTVKPKSYYKRVKKINSKWDYNLVAKLTLQLVIPQCKQNSNSLPNSKYCKKKIVIAIYAQTSQYGFKITLSDYIVNSMRKSSWRYR